MDTVPSDPPPVPPVHKNLSPKKTNPIGDIHQILQGNEAVVPVVERFLESNFGADSQKTLDLTQFQEREVPLQHYWERIFRVTNGQKNAIIKIENLLTIENDSMLPNSTQQSPLLNGRNRVKVKPESPLSMSADEAMSWQKGRAPEISDNSYATVLSVQSPNTNTTGKQPTKTSTLRTERDFLSLVHQKVARGIQL
ncbi:hypothetical protein M3Y97_00118500 [Aphelenchoides bicaudatus]|nr:hypothetical protein M3Y97_00118500 [Aphelenchoides bicaudatus]